MALWKEALFGLAGLVLIVAFGAGIAVLITEIIYRKYMNGRR